MVSGIDFTKLRNTAARNLKYIDNCTVLDVGSGAFPREIEVRPPGDDGARIRAINNSIPGLTTSDTVLISIDNTSHVARVEYYGGDSSVPTTPPQDAQAMVVKNTSGAAAAANDVGYIDSSGEYKTTTTANLEAAWCVVLQGGANNADIYVARYGRVTVAYTGSAPSAGDYLATSTTAGDAAALSLPRPEIFARCLAAGSGGAVSAIMMTNRKFIAAALDDNMWFNSTQSDSIFDATISTSGVSGTKVYYNAPSAGDIDAIDPQVTTQEFKIVLHNTTQSQEAYIDDTGSDGGGNFINVTDSADITGWVSTDVITAQSQTNTASPSSVDFFDMYTLPTSNIPTNCVTLFFSPHGLTDTADQTIFVHPFEADNASKRVRSKTQVSGVNAPVGMFATPLISRRFCIAIDASGSGAMALTLRVRGWVVAEP